jgi:alkylation response protein AidB-like acyl-CoA dehydrogenase
MNFDFSPEQIQLRNEARRFLEDKCPSTAVRRVLDGDIAHDAELWGAMAEMGFLGIAIPEEHGGLGLGYLEQCVVAEELGRALAPVPFSSSVYLATEFLLEGGSEAQRAHWLPRLASGEAIGTFAFAEGAGALKPEAVKMSADGSTLSGTKMPVPDGGVADFAIVAAQAPQGLSLYLVELEAPHVSREAVTTIDPSRPHARLSFENARAESIGTTGKGWALIQRVLDRAAVLTAFEQIGGADKALELACDYTKDRIAFGRPVGSFQAIQHKLADMFVSAALARSNTYYGAWALSAGEGELPEAAAAARITANEAYRHCAREGLQAHGGAGFTWELDCHLHYRRAHLLAVSLGASSYWQDRLIEQVRVGETV